jgi:hypothetical protein
MSLLKKLLFYPTSLLLRLKRLAARSLLNGRFAWVEMDRLGIPGHGTDLVRIDFPPEYKPPDSEQDSVANAVIAALLDVNRSEQMEWLNACLKNADACSGWPLKEDAAHPALPWRETPFLLSFDQISLYGMLRHLRPERYLEIGSGMSTRIAWQARNDGGFGMEMVSIDPEPRLSVAALCDYVHRRRLEDMTQEFLRMVTSRTVVFFDGSHRSFPGSDVTVFFLDILPKLPVGTTVHIHDIYLPFDYPGALHDRLWSEQYMLAAWLLGGARRLKVLLPCAYQTRQAQALKLIAEVLDPGTEVKGCSFWFQIV